MAPPLHVDEAEALLDDLIDAICEACNRGYPPSNYLPFREAYQRVLDAMGAYE